jgi:hypothetical protein
MASKISTKNSVAAASEIIDETASTGDAWIRQRKQPLWDQKSLTKTESLPIQKSSTKYCRCTFEIINKTGSTADVWIRQCKHLLLIRIHQRKPSRCQLRNHQRKLRRCLLKNHHK